MSSDGMPETDALFNIYGIQPTDPEADSIVDRNIETLDRLGIEGWRKLFADSTAT